MEGLHGDKESAQALAMGMQKRAYLQPCALRACDRWAGATVSSGREATLADAEHH